MNLADWPGNDRGTQQLRPLRRPRFHRRPRSHDLGLGFVDLRNPDTVVKETAAETSDGGPAASAHGANAAGASSHQLSGVPDGTSAYRR